MTRDPAEVIRELAQKAEEGDLSDEDKMFIYDVLLNIATNALIQINELGKLFKMNEQANEEEDSGALTLHDAQKRSLS